MEKEKEKEKGKEKKFMRELCNGIGLVKNKNINCVKCDASRGVYTQNTSKEEFYKNKFCEFCNDVNTPNSSPKTHCLKCLYDGYYSNSDVICYSCKI